MRMLGGRVPGVKTPSFSVAGIARTKVRAYLRSNDKGKSNSKGKGKSRCRSNSTNRNNGKNKDNDKSAS
jgi:hypothetical protein